MKMLVMKGTGVKRQKLCSKSIIRGRHPQQLENTAKVERVQNCRPHSTSNSLKRRTENVGNTIESFEVTVAALSKHQFN